MKLFSTLHSLSSSSSTPKSPKGLFGYANQQEEDIHTLQIIDEMVAQIEMEAPSDTSVSIILEYARQKSCLL